MRNLNYPLIKLIQNRFAERKQCKIIKTWFNLFVNNISFNNGNAYIYRQNNLLLENNIGIYMLQSSE